MSDSEGATSSPSSSSPPSRPTTLSAFRPPSKTKMVLPVVLPTLQSMTQPYIPDSVMTPNVESVAKALFQITTPPFGDGDWANAKSRWQMCIYAVINKGAMLNQQDHQHRHQIDSILFRMVVFFLSFRNTFIVLFGGGRLNRVEKRLRVLEKEPEKHVVNHLEDGIVERQTS
ncbi:unnamed protein product [Caenorhabditis brenneri]